MTTPSAPRIPISPARLRVEAAVGATPLPAAKLMKPSGEFTPQGAALLADLARAVDETFGDQAVRLQDASTSPPVAALVLKLAAARDTVEDILADPDTRAMFRSR